METYFYVTSLSSTPSFSTSGPSLIVAGSFLITFSTIAWIIIIGSHEDAFLKQTNQQSKPLFNASPQQAFNNFPLTQIQQTQQKNVSMIPTTTQRPVGMGPQGLGIQGANPQNTIYNQSMQSNRNTSQTNLQSGQTTPLAPASQNETKTNSPEFKSMTPTSTANTSASPTFLAAIPQTDLFTSMDELLKNDVICKCVALYPYTADQSDPKEISFVKGDVFEILDNSGKWWQARRDGSEEVRIVPSNYMKVV